MRMQDETITWIPSDWKKPDVNMTVLLFHENDGVMGGYWDDNEESWMDVLGQPIDDVLYWSDPKGPVV
jgi:hypothetical protein